MVWKCPSLQHVFLSQCSNSSFSFFDHKRIGYNTRVHYYDYGLLFSISSQEFQLHELGIFECNNQMSGKYLSTTQPWQSKKMILLVVYVCLFVGVSVCLSRLTRAQYGEFTAIMIINVKADNCGNTQKRIFWLHHTTSFCFVFGLNMIFSNLVMGKNL